MQHFALKLRRRGPEALLFGVMLLQQVYEGYSLPFAVKRLDLAGRDLTQHMVKLLRGAGHNLDTTAGHEVAREVKERLCYVALDYNEALAQSRNNSALEREYELPDGGKIRVYLCAPPSFKNAQYSAGSCSTQTAHFLCRPLPTRSHTVFPQLVWYHGARCFTTHTHHLHNALRSHPSPTRTTTKAHRCNPWQIDPTNSRQASPQPQSQTPAPSGGWVSSSHGSERTGAGSEGNAKGATVQMGAGEGGTLEWVWWELTTPHASPHGPAGVLFCWCGFGDGSSALRFGPWTGRLF